MKSFFAGITEFGLNFSAVVNLIILSVIYILGIGVTCLIAKSLNKHFLELNCQPRRKTYWVKFNRTVDSLSDSLKQY